MKSSSKKRHDDFIREIQSPLKQAAEIKSQRLKVVPIEKESTPTEEEIQKALEAKFDELFGALSEDG